MPRRPAPASNRLDPVSVCVLATFVLAYALFAAIRGVPAWATLLYAGASLLCFTLYAVDKSAAIDGRGRISESTLLWLGAAGGWPGAIVAQQLLRHKTAKRSFRLRFWLSVAANAAVFACVATR